MEKTSSVLNMTTLQNDTIGYVFENVILHYVKASQLFNIATWLKGKTLCILT